MKDKENKAENKISSIVLKAASIILVIVGIVLLLIQPINNQVAKHNQNQALTQLTSKKIKKNKKTKGMYNYNKVKPMSLKQSLKATGNADNVRPIGALSIPDVNLHTPISNGLSDAAMSAGGGTMRPGEVMGKGNYALAGHYMTAKGILFSPLEDTQLGQLVYITNLKKIYTYKIYFKKIVPPTAVYLAKNTRKPIITLITCADGGKNRWSIRGKLVKTANYKQKDAKMFQIN